MNPGLPAIKAEHLSKVFRIGLKERVHENFASMIFSFLNSPFENYRKYRSLYRFKDMVKGAGEGSDLPDIIWAIRDISFQAAAGDVLGLIGRNGAGKSTLLKILSRVTEPTTGWAEIRGRVSSLLEVGTGFHPELSGRDNVYLNGVVLGMTKNEVNRKFDQIVDFSGVEKFIDTPIKRYSSGMKVRLAFAVAAHLEPEILIVDEVLAVGDAEFQAKCLGKMDQVARQGRTVLFVSHNIGAVTRLCNRALWMDGGRIRKSGSATEIANEYLSSGLHSSANWKNASDAPREEVELRGVRVLSKDGKVVDMVQYDSSFSIEIDYELFRPLRAFSVICQLSNSSGEPVWTSWDTDSTDWMSRTREAGSYQSVCRVPGKILGPGMYSISLGSCTPANRFAYHERIISFVVSEIGFPLNMGRQGVIKPILQWDVTKMSSLSE